jgi:hypothetical protein
MGSKNIRASSEVEELIEHIIMAYPSQEGMVRIRMPREPEHHHCHHEVFSALGHNGPGIGVATARCSFSRQIP